MSLSYSPLFLLRPTRPTILIYDLVCLFPHYSSIDILCLNSSWCSHCHLISCHLRYPLPISVCLSVCFSLFLSLNLSLLIDALSLFLYLSHLTPSFHLPLSLPISSLIYPCICLSTSPTGFCAGVFGAMINTPGDTVRTVVQKRVLGGLPGD